MLLFDSAPSPIQFTPKLRYAPTLLCLCAHPPAVTTRVGHQTNHWKIMNLHLSLTPLISLLAGILILLMPKLLNLIVAIYLIVIGLVGLFGAGALRLN